MIYMITTYSEALALWVMEAEMLKIWSWQTGIPGEGRYRCSATLSLKGEDKCFSEKRVRQREIILSYALFLSDFQQMR